MTRHEKIKAMLGAQLGPGLIPDSPLDAEMGKVLDVIAPIIRRETLLRASEFFGALERHSADGFVQLVNVRRALFEFADSPEWINR